MFILIKCSFEMLFYRFKELLYFEGLLSNFTAFRLFMLICLSRYIDEEDDELDSEFEIVSLTKSLLCEDF